MPHLMLLDFKMACFDIHFTTGNCFFVADFKIKAMVTVNPVK
jgi:hypothetical protein